MTYLAEFLPQYEPQLLPWGRAAFAAACVQRLMPVYLAYTRREEVAPLFDDWLAVAWDALAGKVVVTEEELKQYDEEGLGELPSGEGPGVQATALAVLHVLAELRGNGLGVQACSQTNLEEVGSYVLNVLRIPLDGIDEHALILEEKRRQRRDLEELVAIGMPNPDEQGRFVERIRSRAKNEELKYLVRP